MITDIDDTNVILQDDKYYLVPFISNKNEEDLSGFKKIIDHMLSEINSSNSSDSESFNDKAVEGLNNLSNNKKFEKK